MSQSDKAEIKWFDVQEWGVEGKGWRDTDRFYDRLPARAQTIVREPVWNLSRHATGMSAEFETDATEIRARWTLRDAQIGTPTDAPCGRSGLDLYAADHTGRLRWVMASRAVTSQQPEEVFLSGIDPARRRYRLYLPLFNPVDKVEIGIPAGASLSGVAPRTERPILFYGTSIVHGACASRAGMPHPAILGRRLDRPVLNLGFSGNGQMEPEIAGLLAELDPAVYVLDALPNMQAAQLAERAEPFVRILREAHPQTPIVLVEDRTYTNAWINKGARARNDSSRVEYRRAYEGLVASGVGELLYVEGENLLGEDGEGSVDSSHPTDLGFMRIADALYPILRALL